MLEFAYRYTTEVLEEARVYSNHTKHKRVSFLPQIKHKKLDLFINETDTHNIYKITGSN